MVFDDQKPVIVNLAKIIGKTRFAPYNLINSTNLKAAGYQDQRMGTMLACVSHILSKGLNKPYPSDFVFTSAHFKKPVLYSSLWATLFPKCQPTTPNGKGSYALPFLTLADEGVTAQKPTPRSLASGKVSLLHATCLSKTLSYKPQLDLLHPPHLTQKEKVSHPIYNHLTQSTEPGPVLTFHTLGRPIPMSDKTLAKVQNGDFFALARSIAQATGSMPLIQGSQWPPMQVNVHRCPATCHDLSNVFPATNLLHPPIHKLRAASQTDVLSAGDSSCWDSACIRLQLGPRLPVSKPDRVNSPPLCAVGSASIHAHWEVYRYICALNRTLINSICTRDNGFMLQDTLKNLACDHRAFPLPSAWVPTAMLTGHEPAIHEALVKQIGEFSLPPKAGTDLMLFPLDEIRCSYPGPTVGGTPGLPCNKLVACEYFRVIVDNGVCTTPNNNLGIHVNIGPSQKEMCNHFICIQCLPHWHENVIGKLHHSLGSSPGSKTPVHCLSPPATVLWVTL
jgi:hypothetical protein